MIGKRIKAERLKIGLSQEELGKMFSVTQQAVNKWEAGRSNPDQDMISNLVDLFGCTIDYLVGRTNERGSNEQSLERTSSPTDHYLTDLLKKVPDLTDEEKESLEEHMQFALKIIEKERQRRKAAAQNKDGDLI